MEEDISILFKKIGILSMLLIMGAVSLDPLSSVFIYGPYSVVPGYMAAIGIILSVTLFFYHLITVNAWPKEKDLPKEESVSSDQETPSGEG